MASLPKTYKAAVLEEVGGDFILKDLPLKEPGPGQVLVKVLACGVCGSDKAEQQGHSMNSWPIVPGHEIVGEVVAFGPGADTGRLQIGDRVGGQWHGGRDSTCRACQRGQFQMCDNAKVNGVSFDGGYAEYVLLQQEAVPKLPKDIDPAETAPLMCAGITTFNSIRKLGVPQGSLVAVQGLGGLGHLAVQYAAAMGYEVVAVSSGESKRAFAQQLGAHHYIDSSKEDAVQALQKLGGADLVVATAPNADAIAPLLMALQAGGKMLVLAPVGPVPFNTGAMVLKGLSVHGWPSGHALDSEEAVRFSHLHGIKCMIEKFPLADVQKAFDHMASGKVRFRSVLVM